MALLGGIVKQQDAHHVAGERENVMALEPGALAGAGQADGEYDGALWLFGRLDGGLRLSLFLRRIGFRRLAGGTARLGQHWGRRSGLRTSAASAASTTAVTVAPELLLAALGRGRLGFRLRLLKLRLVRLGLEFRLAFFWLPGGGLGKYRLQRRGGLGCRLLRLFLAPPVTVA